ncbi:MAG: hypothetical protein AAGK04_03905 [Planctomycetota bacterium]
MVAFDLKTVRPMAPEDLRPRQYVCVVRVVHERWPSPWDEQSWQKVTAPMRVEALPKRAPTPLYVVDVCLPTVLVQDVRDRAQMLDIRRVRLARVDARYARMARRRLRATHEAVERERDGE